MSLSKRVLLTIAGTLGPTVLALLAFSELILGASYRALERETVELNATRAVNALQNIPMRLSRSVADWAMWDDAWRFVADRNPEFITATIPDGVFANLGIDFLAFVDLSGELTYGAGYDSAAGQRTPAPPEIADWVKDGLLPAPPADDWPGVRGFVRARDGTPLAIAARRITRSTAEGPCRGVLVMGARCDAATARQLAVLTQLRLRLDPYERWLLAGDLRALPGEFADDRCYHAAADTPDARGSVLLRDLEGRPLAVVSVDIPRSIHRQGLAVRGLLAASLLTVSVLCGLLMLWLLNRHVVFRLRGLAGEVAAIGDGADAAARVSAKGRDEVARLAAGINGMLDALRTSEKALEAVRAGLEASVRERTAELEAANQALRAEAAERLHAQESLRESEARLRSVIESSPLGMQFYALESDGRLVLTGANRAADEMLGVEHALLAGRSIEDAFPALVTTEVPNRLRGVAFTGRGWHAEQLVYESPLASGVFEVHAFQTSPMKMAVALLDIADRKRAETALRESEERYRAFVNATPSPILVIREGRVAFINPAGATLLRYDDPCELEGKPVAELIAPEFRAVAGQRMASASRGLSNAAVEMQLAARDGSRPVIASTSVPIRLAGEPAILVVGHDVTERKRAEAERQKLEARVLQAQKFESLSILTAGIAHDFNNILMAIMGNAALCLEDTPPGAPLRRELEDIDTAARRAADLCRQMLAYAGKSNPRPERTNLSRLVQSMVATLAASTTRKAAIKTRLDAELPDVEADSGQLRQVLLALVTNAVEAIGDADGTVEIATRPVACTRDMLADMRLGEDLPEGPYSCVEITDDGCGMAPEVVERVFDPFFTTKFQGRGLGLAAVLGIVGSHHGAIRIQSAPGRGSTFGVYLPSLQPAADEERADTAPAAARAGGHGTVLVVDDEDAVRHLAGRMLERLGFSVISACDGVEAVEVFRRLCSEIDWVVLDLTMPRMDGLRAFEELRRVRPDVRVLISSGYGEPVVTERFAGERPAGFLQKPYTLAALEAKFRQLGAL